jgi:hypothetical protein
VSRFETIDRKVCSQFDDDSLSQVAFSDYGLDAAQTARWSYFESQVPHTVLVESASSLHSSENPAESTEPQSQIFRLTNTDDTDVWGTRMSGYCFTTLGPNPACRIRLLSRLTPVLGHRVRN